MQKNIFLFRHDVDNDIIDSFLKFIRKNCVTENEKEMRNRENGRSYFQIRVYQDAFVIEDTHLCYIFRISKTCGLHMYKKNFVTFLKENSLFF